MMNFWQEKAKMLAGAFPRERLEAHAIAQIERTKNVAVACSGGIDSLSALLLTWAHFPALREHFYVLHFNHAQRGNASDGDEIFVAEVCKELGVEFVCEKLNAENCGHSENALREARLSFFEKSMRSRGVEILVQGHQADDVAESLVMRISRGAGTNGLAAPRPISFQKDKRIFLRPFIEIPKKEFISALKKNAIPWREDASNSGNDYFRNRVRNEILPRLRNATSNENFLRSRMLAEEDADALDEIADNLKLGESRLPAVVRRQLWAIFTEHEIVPNPKNIDSLVSAVCAGTVLKFSAGISDISWDGNALLIVPANSNSPEKIHFPRNIDDPDSPISSEIVEITPELFSEIRNKKFPESETVFLAGMPKLFLKEWENGDRYRPLGAPGEKSVGDIFTNKKIPRERRKMLPLICDGTGIAWIPTLPPAERFRILSAGTTALRLTYCGASLLLSSEQFSNE